MEPDRQEELDKQAELDKPSIRVRERVKLLAWMDSVTASPVLVDLTFAGHVPDLEALSRHINLSDLLEAVRQADQKLPEIFAVKGAEEGDTADEDEDTVEINPFKLPEVLQDKRYVFPPDLESLVQDDIFKKENLSPLRPLMVGRGEGKPLTKLGLLGRAANEEGTGTSDAPFYYATVLQLVKFLSERAYGQLLNEGKVAGAYDDMLSLFQAWTTGLSGKIRHTGAVERLLSNPLSPYALRRQPRPVPLDDAEKQYLSVAPNSYRLTYEAARALDTFTDNAASGDDPVEKAESVLSTFEHAAEFRAGERRAARTADKYTGWVAGLSGIGWFAYHMLRPGPPPELASQLNLPVFLIQGAASLLIISGLYLLGAMAAKAFLQGRRHNSKAWREYLSLRARMAGNSSLAANLARAVTLGKLVKAAIKKGQLRFNAGLTDIAIAVKSRKKGGRKLRALLRRAQFAKKPLSREWLDDIPSILAGYRKLKVDEADYAHISSLAHPAIDFSDGYQENELKEMWLQNACVVYGDLFPSLIIGKAATASVYFMDVTGSTELSTKGNLSNTLAVYSRLLTYVNETGIKPIWRKEMGDGRFYCHPNHEALKRAVMTSQGCAHPSVGVGVGIGFSVGEIYTDVRTGDFQNEVTNRASRLNARDEVAASWISARYARHPLKVHVKFGRLVNRGIAMDEKALNAFGVTHDEAVRTVPPFEWKFPVMVEMNGRHILGSVSYLVARVETVAARLKLAELGEEERFRPVLDRPKKAKAFEVYCHLSDPHLPYTTPEDKKGATEFLAEKGAKGALFVDREADTEIPVDYKPITLPTGETVMVIIKREKTHLRGLGYTAIGEVDIPSVAISDPTIKLQEFFSKP